MNVWNLRSGKARLEIMQRTQAQKRHLINLISAKSKVDSHSTVKPRSHLSLLPCNKRQVERDNESMVKRIMRISRSHAALNDSMELTSLSRNLKTYSSLNRTIRLKEIEEQNSRMFSRLITAAPTIRRQQWIKRDIQTSKYKENLLRSKYVRPDYSQEACKMIIQQPKFKNINVRGGQPKVVKVGRPL